MRNQDFSSLETLNGLRCTESQRERIERALPILSKMIMRTRMVNPLTRITIKIIVPTPSPDNISNQMTSKIVSNTNVHRQNDD